MKRDRAGIQEAPRHPDAAGDDDHLVAPVPPRPEQNPNGFPAVTRGRFPGSVAVGLVHEQHGMTALSEDSLGAPLGVAGPQGRARHPDELHPGQQAPQHVQQSGAEPDDRGHAPAGVAPKWTGRWPTSGVGGQAAHPAGTGRGGIPGRRSRARPTEPESATTPDEGEVLGIPAPVPGHVPV